MKIKVLLVFTLLFSFFAISANATNARVESMGKNSTFIMDDISIFDNPANINVYPNYLLGEFGPYVKNVETGTNSDPDQPFFGGIFSLSLSKEDSGDPRVSIGGIFNRDDKDLYKLLPDEVRMVNSSGQLVKIPVPEPATKFDGFLGFSTNSGNMYGAHIYIGHQQGAVETEDGYAVNDDAFASIGRFDLGANIELSNTEDLELSVGIGRVQFGPKSQKFFDSELMSYFIDGRMFSTIAAIDGELVPAASFELLRTNGIEERTLTAGPGVNVFLDRGFFWLGVEGFFKDSYHDHLNDSAGYKYYYYDDNTTVERNKEHMKEYGGKVSFGIERNIWADWFVIRVGGQKVISYRKYIANTENVLKQAGQLPTQLSSLCQKENSSSSCTSDGSYWYTNPAGDGSESDHIGFGIGINVEEKLKVDVTVAEDFLYRNFFQGEGRFFSRISATYSF